MKKMGKFITFDGRHGVGKSFVIGQITKELHERGFQVHVTKEPTDSVIGKLARSSEQIERAEHLVCLFAADRYQHCEEVNSMLCKGISVLSDRYVISSLILQNMDNVEFSYIHEVNKKITPADLSIVLYAPHEIIVERMKNKKITRLAAQELFEKEDRYVKHKDLILKYYPKTQYFTNTTAHDVEQLRDLVIRTISS